jgi:hypothetical protein
MNKIKALIKLVIMYFLNGYYRFKFKFKSNSKKDNILIYTDSRGFLMNCFLCNKTPKKSYIDMLSKEYNIDYQLCTKKHTTILDFLDFIENKDISKYSHIVLHLGIVDFSPRPLSQFDMVYTLKNKLAKKLFPNIEMNPQYYNDLYENEKTFSLYNVEYLRDAILPKLVNISQSTHIVWLGMNKVDLTWNGNYFKARPGNINNILVYQNSIKDFLDKNDSNIKYIDIDKIENFNNKLHTVDNMHLSIDGFELFYKVINKALKK